MRQRAQEIVSRGDSLFAKRYPLMSLCQQMAENFHVMRADFTRQRDISEEFASYLMTGRPAMAHRDLANALPALMRPRDRQWLWARTHDKRTNENRNARAYLDWLSEQQFRAMYDARAAMVRSCKEADGDWAAFGNAVLTVDPNEWRDGILVRCHHFRDVVWTDGNDLRVNQVHHKHPYAVRDMLRLFPGKVSSKVAEMMAKEPDREIVCRRVIVPTGEYDLPVKNRDRTPFVSLTVDVENDCILEEKAVARRGYVIPRWATVSGSQYAYSPACVYGLPDARMLQQITLTMLEAGQKATDPPMIAVGDAISGGVNIGAGMVNYVDADYDERTGQVLRPMEMRFDGIKFGADREERVSGQLDAIFFLNQIRLPQITKEMTAFEASKLYEEFQRNALPLLEPVEVDYNAALASECYEALTPMVNPTTQQPYFGSPYDVPEELRGQEIRWEFDTPMKAAAEQAKVFAFTNMTDILAKAMQIDPDAAAEVDMRKGERDAIIGVGGADWLLPDEDALKIRQQKAQAAKMAQAADAMAHGADAGTRVATAVKSAAEARQALADGGGLQ